MNKGDYIIIAVPEDREVYHKEEMIKSFNEIKHRLDFNKMIILN